MPGQVEMHDCRRRVAGVEMYDALVFVTKKNHFQNDRFFPVRDSSVRYFPVRFSFVDRNDRDVCLLKKCSK